MKHLHNDPSGYIFDLTLLKMSQIIRTEKTPDLVGKRKILDIARRALIEVLKRIDPHDVRPDVFR